jgi:hypothetical protein
MALGKAKKNNEATTHVEACLEASRDGGSNPPASSLRSELGIERRLPRHSASEDGLSFKTLCDAPNYVLSGHEFPMLLCLHTP